VTFDLFDFELFGLCAIAVQHRQGGGEFEKIDQVDLTEMYGANKFLLFVHYAT
jgi:hypothetical protein